MSNAVADRFINDPHIKGTNSIVFTKKQTTLRLIMPQWQGGNVHDYYFGSQLLAWLAPLANGPVDSTRARTTARRNH
jgi:hypothetical protein